MTDITKIYQQTMTAHFAIDDMQAMLAGTLPAKRKAQLVSMGFDEDFARAVLPHVARSGELNIPQLAKWPEPALAARFLAGVAGEARRAVPTAGPSTKSVMSRGFFSTAEGRREYALMTIPFQYMTFGMAATQKILVSGLQGRDANALGGMLALVGFAYIGLYLRTPSHVWDKMEADDRWLRAVEYSGILGSIGDMNHILEMGSKGTFGARPMLGLPHPYQDGYDGMDQAGVLAGAGGAKILDAWSYFNDPSLTDWQRCSLMRRAIPGNNLFYLDGLFRDGQAAIQRD
jgi:hypothetical protein